MISHAFKFIFIHIPKTGGNSIQRVIAPFSDDRIQARSTLHQDGVDRFGIVGRITPHKHVELDYYARHVQLERFRVVTCSRHPVDRLLSCYFSPSKWYIRRRDGQWWLQDPYWDRKRFLETLEPAAGEYLEVGGIHRRPDVILRFETLRDDFAAFVRAVGIPVDGTLPRLNARPCVPQAIDEAKRDPIVQEVAQSRYKADYSLFGYALS